MDIAFHFAVSSTMIEPHSLIQEAHRHQFALGAILHLITKEFFADNYSGRHCDSTVHRKYLQR